MYILVVSALLSYFALVQLIFDELAYGNLDHKLLSYLLHLSCHLCILGFSVLLLYLHVEFVLAKLVYGSLGRKVY